MPRRRRRSHVYWQEPPPPRRAVNRCRALLVIDNRPLHEAAWADLVRARKRLEKAAREVHRHEETDEPAFRAWLTATFPTLLSALRALAEQVEAKTRLVQAVESESFFTGRPPAKIWREWQQHGGQPPPPSPDLSGDDAEPGARAAGGDPFADAENSFDEEMKRLFGANGIDDDDDPFGGAFRDFARGIFGFERAPAPALAGTDARDIYRRLVRHLHPDSGGAWTPTRAHQWEQVQAAWQARDTDWLARLEAEWEVHADLLGLASPVSRLRAALAEIDAARRDAERRVRRYRTHDAWRFSLRPTAESLRGDVERQMRRDEISLRTQLDHLEEVLAGWERSRPNRAQRRRQTAGQRDFGF